MHAFAERLPQTSQSCSEAAKRGGSTDAADAEAGGPAADAEGGDADDEMFCAGGSADSDDAAAGADAGADAAGEGGVGEGVSTAWGVADIDGTVAALDGFPPFFFVMVGCLTIELTSSNKGFCNHCTVLRDQRSEAASGEGECGTC